MFRKTTIGIGSRLLYAALFVSIFSLTGCKGKENNTNLNPQQADLRLLNAVLEETGEQNLRMSGTTWDAGDGIGVSAFRASSGEIYAPLQNSHYVTLTGDGMFRQQGEGEAAFPNDGSALSLVAYYPYKADLQGEELPIDLSVQQEILYSNNLTSVSKASPGVQKLLFKRVLARLVLSIKVDNPSLPLTAKIVDIPTKATLNVKNGMLTPSTTKEELPLEVKKEGNLYVVTTFLLPPVSDKTQLVFSHGGKNYRWTVPQTIKAGESLRSALSLKGGSSPEPGLSSSYPEIPAYALGGENPNTKTIYHYVADASWITGTYWPKDGLRNYTVEYDVKNKATLWVAYPMHSCYLGNAHRTNEWDWDPKLDKDLQPNLSSSYKGWTSMHEQGYPTDLNRGHLLASASRNASKEINKTTFYYSNMTPQDGAFNQGPWGKLEDKFERGTVNRFGTDTIYVVTGCIYENNPPMAKDKDGKSFATPKYMYKAFMRYDRGSKKYQTIAIKMPNKKGNAPYTNTSFHISVKQLEQETGYTFFPSVPNEAKSTVGDISQWN